MMDLNLWSGVLITDAGIDGFTSHVRHLRSLVLTENSSLTDNALGYLVEVWITLEIKSFSSV
jgi:hypothetical protein